MSRSRRGCSFATHGYTYAENEACDELVLKPLPKGRIRIPLKRWTPKPLPPSERSAASKRDAVVSRVSHATVAKQATPPTVVFSNRVLGNLVNIPSTVPAVTITETHLPRLKREATPGSLFSRCDAGVLNWIYRSIIDFVLFTLNAIRVLLLFNESHARIIHWLASIWFEKISDCTLYPMLCISLDLLIINWST